MVLIVYYVKFIDQFQRILHSNSCYIQPRLPISWVTLSSIVGNRWCIVCLEYCISASLIVPYLFCINVNVFDYGHDFLVS